MIPAAFALSPGISKSTNFAVWTGMFGNSKQEAFTVTVLRDIIKRPMIPGKPRKRPLGHLRLI